MKENYDFSKARPQPLRRTHEKRLHRGLKGLKKGNLTTEEMKEIEEYATSKVK